jgi:hypothetical protein
MPTGRLDPPRLNPGRHDEARRNDFVSKEAVRASPERTTVQELTSTLPQAQENRIDLLTVQFDRHGGGFSIAR